METSGKGGEEEEVEKRKGRCENGVFHISWSGLINVIFFRRDLQAKKVLFGVGGEEEKIHSFPFPASYLSVFSIIPQFVGSDQRNFSPGGGEPRQVIRSPASPILPRSFNIEKYRCSARYHS